MKVICIADTHGLHDKLKVPNGDILVHAGDFTNRGEPYEVDRFLDWLEKLPHAHKVFVAGNHEFYVEEHNEYFIEQVRAIDRVTYLQDSGAIVAGVKFWGSPITPRFCDWAFNCHRGAEIKKHWDLIPANTEVLVTHGPPKDIFDENWRREHHGCEVMRYIIDTKLHSLRLHVFGHIHPPGGNLIELGGKIFVNAAQCDESGYIRQRPVTVDLDTLNQT